MKLGVRLAVMIMHEQKVVCAEYEKKKKLVERGVVSCIASHSILLVRLLNST